MIKPYSDVRFEASKIWYAKVQNNMSIVPSIATMINRLMATIDKKNRTIEKLNKKLKSFEESGPPYGTFGIED